MMQTFVVILQDRDAFLLAGVVFGRGIDDVAGEDFLPEGEAAGGTWSRDERRRMGESGSWGRGKKGERGVALEKGGEGGGERRTACESEA